MKMTVNELLGMSIMVAHIHDDLFGEWLNLNDEDDESLELGDLLEQAQHEANKLIDSIEALMIRISI